MPGRGPPSALLPHPTFNLSKVVVLEDSEISSSYSGCLTRGAVEAGIEKNLVWRERIDAGESSQGRNFQSERLK